VLGLYDNDGWIRRALLMSATITLIVYTHCMCYSTNSSGYAHVDKPNTVMNKANYPET